MMRPYEEGLAKFTCGLRSSAISALRSLIQIVGTEEGSVVISVCGLPSDILTRAGFTIVRTNESSARSIQASCMCALSQGEHIFRHYRARKCGLAIGNCRLAHLSVLWSFLHHKWWSAWQPRLRCWNHPILEKLA